MTLDLTKTAERFTLGFVPVLKAQTGPDGKRRLHGVASSTVQDRHGDVMTRTALEDMLEQSNRGLTIFLNHSYNVPEDVAGTVERASLKQAAADIHDLSFDIVINENNDRAVQAWEAIQSGVQLGLSIGAMIPEGGAKVDRKSGQYTIDHVDLVETSIVGVPANPRSWVEYAAKALRKQTAPAMVTSVWQDVSGGTSNNVSWTFKQGDETPEGEKEVEPPPIHPTPESEYEPPAPPVTTDDLSGDVPDGAGADEAAKTEELQKSVDPDEKDPDAASDEEEVDETNVEPPPIEPVPGSPPPEPPITADDLLKMADAINPAKQDATVTVETPFANVTVDTGNRGKDPAAESSTPQEAPKSAPENEGVAGTPWHGIPGMPAVQQTVDIASIVAKELRQSAELVTTLNRELSTVRTALDDERTLRRAAEQERDRASADLTKVLRETKQILDKLAATPVGRRTTYHEAVGRFEAIRSFYGDEITNTLARSIE